jgi:hypothetical protein
LAIQGRKCAAVAREANVRPLEDNEDLKLAERAAAESNGRKPPRFLKTLGLERRPFPQRVSLRQKQNA